MRKITTAITAILLAAMMTAGISAYDAETAEKQADAINEMAVFSYACPIPRERGRGDGT